MNRWKVGGALLIAAAAFLARETVVWLFNRLLDAASSGVRGGVTFVSFSWLNAVAVVLAAVGILLVAWPRKKPAPVRDVGGDLWPSASNIINRVRNHRSARWYERDRLEPASDIARDGVALLVTFEKAGFQVPLFKSLYAEQVAAGLEAYFSSLVPLMRQGHVAEARSVATNAAEAAVSVANSLKVEAEWFYPEF